jgi:hypothetical protein
MNNFTNNAAPTSASNLAKEAKQCITKTEKKQRPLSRAKAGIENPCKFGAVNPNFNKYCL